LKGKDLIMIVHHFGGDIECNTTKKLLEVLNLKYGNCSNEFILSGETEYPYMAIMVKGDFAVVSFFIEESDWILQAVNNDKDLELDENNIFYTGNDEMEIEICNEFVLPFSKAIIAAEEFFKTKSLPKCLKWSKQ
jgi:hypothetical protein